MNYDWLYDHANYADSTQGKDAQLTSHLYLITEDTLLLLFPINN